MTERAVTTRVQPMSAGVAIVRVIVTLVLFVAMFIVFLIAPLVALGLGYAVYVVWSARGSRTPAAKAPGGSAPRPSASASAGFGSGAA